MAFDNYDRFVETKNGNNDDKEEEAEATATRHNKRRRRSFEAIQYELPHCAEKLKKTTNIQSELEEEINISVYKNLYDLIDNIWMLSHAFG